MGEYSYSEGYFCLVYFDEEIVYELECPITIKIYGNASFIAGTTARDGDIELIIPHSKVHYFDIRKETSSDSGEIN